MRAPSCLVVRSEGSGTSLPEAGGGGPTAAGQIAIANVRWSLLGRSAQWVISLLWSVLVPRILGPSVYGAYALLASVGSLPRMFSDLGANAILTRAVPEFGQQEDRRGLSEVFTILLVLRVAITGAFVPLIIRLATGTVPYVVPPWLMWVWALTSIPEIMCSTFVGLIYGRNRLREIAILGPAQTAALCLLVPTGFLLWGFSGVVAGIVVAPVITWWVALSVSRPWPLTVISPASIRRTLPFLAFGLPFALEGMTSLTMLRGGNLVLGLIGVSTAEVAVLALAVNFCFQGVSLVSALAWALTPGIASLVAGHDTARAKYWVRQVATYGAVASVLMTAVFAGIGVPVAVLVLGEKYRGIELPLIVGCTATTPLFFRSLAVGLSNAWRVGRLAAESWVATVAPYVIGIALLGMVYGSIGAVAAFALAAWLSGMFASWRCHQVIGAPVMTWKELLVMLAGVPGIAGIMMADAPATRVECAILTLAYLPAVLVLLSIVNVQDLKQIMSRPRSATDG